MLFDRLAKLFSSPPRLIPDIAGGAPDLLGIYRCVGQLTDGKPGEPYLILGTGVVLESEGSQPDVSWVLTVAHCLKNEPEVIFVTVGNKDTAGDTETIRVAAIHLQSGKSFAWKAGQKWPSLSPLPGDDDAFVLLELEGKFDASKMTHRAMPSRTRRVRNDPLVVVGWGVDGTGNPPHTARFGTVRQRITSKRRGKFRRKRLDLFNGMPRQQDSGSAVFFPPMDNPFTGFYRLCGIHVARPVPIPAGSEEVGYYLAIKLDTERWIQRVLYPQVSTFSAKKTFWLRKQDECDYITSIEDFTKYENQVPGEPTPVWNFLRHVAGSGNYLKKGDKVTFVATTARTGKMTIQHSASADVVDVHIDGVAGLQHWLEGTLNGATYYAFMLTTRFLDPVYNKDTRWIHLEVFKPNSGHVKPGPCNISDGTCPNPLSRLARAGGDDDLTYDQDDHGNGHEPPR